MSLQKTVGFLSLPVIDGGTVYRELDLASG